MPSQCRRGALPATAAALFIVLVCGPAHAESYIFDKRRTEVRFTYFMGPAKQNGHFTRVDGTLQFDDNAPERSRVTATIATASLETGQPIVDDALKGSDFFDVVAHPAMTFKSRSVQSTGSDTAEMAGDITVNGITKPVTLDVSLRPHSNPALKYSIGAREFIAKTRIKRSDFNMTAYQSMVDDEVDIEIDAIVRKKQ